RLNLDSVCVAIFRILLGQTSLYRVQFGSCLRHAHAGFESRHYSCRSIVSSRCRADRLFLGDSARTHSGVASSQERSPERRRLAAARKNKSRRHYAHDRSDAVADAKVFAHNRGRGMKIADPECVTQNDWVAFVLFVVHGEAAAEKWRHAQHAKEIAGHKLRINQSRHLVSIRRKLSCRARRERRYRLESFALLPPIKKVGKRNTVKRSTVCTGA